MTLKKIYTIIIYIHLFIIFISCKKNNNNLVYNVNGKEVELVLNNGNKYVSYDETIPLKFIVKNLKSIETRIACPGISVSIESDSILSGSINVKKNYIKAFPNFINNDTLHIKIFIIDKIKNKGEILIPIK